MQAAFMEYSAVYVDVRADGRTSVQDIVHSITWLVRFLSRSSNGSRMGRLAITHKPAISKHKHGAMFGAEHDNSNMREAGQD